MKISSSGIDLIKHFEGLRLRAYRDPAGILTIGYGHTETVAEGQVITEAEAEALLRQDLDRFERGVSDLITAETHEWQFDALVSLAFNIGLGAFEGSTVLRRHNAGDYEGAGEAINWWNKAGGEVLAGLVRRRLAEEELYIDGLEEMAAEERAPCEVRDDLCFDDAPDAGDVIRVALCLVAPSWIQAMRSIS